MTTTETKTKAQHTPVMFAMSRKARKAELMTGFACFEHLQGAFRCGILLTDGTQADGIGTVPSVSEFLNRAAHSNISVVWNDDAADAKLEIQLPYGKWSVVSYYVFRSWTGKRRISGKPYKGPVFVLGTERAVA
jgi:hypothetical protein